MDATAFLDAYFERVAYSGDPAPTLQTLRELHRAHLRAIPYENLDLHLDARPDPRPDLSTAPSLTLDERRIFDKLVVARRGGWCYEMNGLFAAVLTRLGFAVRLLGCAVQRSDGTTGPLFGHLALRVEVGGASDPYLVDVGFGDGLLEPIPLRVGSYRQDPLRFELSRLGRRWTLHNHPDGGAAGFAFTLEPRSLADFAAMSRAQQTSPAYGFVRTIVCQRPVPNGLLTLRGATLRSLSAVGVSERVITARSELEGVLHDRFGLRVEVTPALWERVWAAHLAWRGAGRGREATTVGARGLRPAYGAAIYRSGERAFALSPHPPGAEPFAGRDYAVVTAHNPGSRPLPAQENAGRHRALLSSLRERGLDLAPSTSEAPDGSWREEGVVVFDLSLHEALELGRRFGQHAVLYGHGRRVALAWCERAHLEWFYSQPR